MAESNLSSKLGQMLPSTASVNPLTSRINTD